MLKLNILLTVLLVWILEGIIAIKVSFCSWKHIMFSNSNKQYVDTFYRLLNRDYTYDFVEQKVVVKH